MFGKPHLFLSAYTPLFALLAVRFEPLWPMLTCVTLELLGVGSLLLLRRLDARASSGAHQIKEVRDAGAEAGAYLGAYLLPFLTVATPRQGRDRLRRVPNRFRSIIVLINRSLPRDSVTTC